MADLLIRKTGNGVAKVTTTDPFSSLEIHRIDRTAWEAAPDRSGVYLLYGFVGEESATAAYVGKSTTSIRDRIRRHHATPRRDWFGVLFAIPLPPVLCQTIEAELIRRIREAGVVAVIDNVEREERWLDADDVHVPPALAAIIDALEMVLGSDIFTQADLEDTGVDVESLERPARLARVYKAQASESRLRADADPSAATHAYVGAGIRAWGRFEAAEPDTRFRVLAGSAWRRPNLDPAQASYAHQLRVANRQQALLDDGTLEADAMSFARDFVFENWSQAVGVVSGKGSYSGGYHWQRLESVPVSAATATAAGA